MKPPIWFERPILAGADPDPADRVQVLAPTRVDAFAGLEHAVGVLAGVRTYDGSFMDRAPRLLAIARTGIGVDTVDIAEATARGIAVCNAPEGPTVSTAEHAVMLMLMAAKRATVSMDRLRRAETDLYARNEAIELMGKTLGLIGFGRIARRVASAAMALGMYVRVFDPYVTSFPEAVTTAPDLSSLLSTSDVVSVHVPLTESTRHLMDGDAFAAMREGAVFVNTARGGLVDQDALLAAIQSGRLFAAAVDVTEPEPLPPAHPLLHDERILVTPHVASGTSQGMVNNFTMALDQLIQVVGGEQPPHLVNPAVWERLLERRAESLAS